MTDPSTRTPTAQGAPAEPSYPARLILAVTAAWAVSLMGYYAQAQLLGPLMQELGLGEEAVGWMFSVENAALALATLAAAGPLARWSSDGAWTLGDALGPGLAGTLVERGGYLPLAAMALLVGLACLVAVLGVLRRFEARS